MIRESEKTLSGTKDGAIEIEGSKKGDKPFTSMSTEKKNATKYKYECQKVPYKSKKEAKKAAESQTGRKGVKYKVHNCKLCSEWHIYSANLKQIQHNRQHSRGGRSLRRKKTSRRRRK